MALGFLSRNRKLPILLLHLAIYSIMGSMSSATVVVIGNNITLSFDDLAATFAPPVKSSGICGQLYLAEPLDACSQLTNKTHTCGNSSSPFALIIRGHCSFEEKVRRVQTSTDGWLQIRPTLGCNGRKFCWHQNTRGLHFKSSRRKTEQVCCPRQYGAVDNS